MPHVVIGFSSCLGAPRHAINDSEFVTAALAGQGVRHDNLLDLVKDVVEDYRFAAIRLLQVCGVHGASAISLTLCLSPWSTTSPPRKTRQLLQP